MKNKIPKETEALIVEAEKSIYVKKPLSNKEEIKKMNGCYSIKEILEATKNIEPDIWKNYK